MSTFKLVTFTYAYSATPVPLHTGVNTPGQPPITTAGWVVQPSANVYFGDSTVTTSTGLLVKRGQTMNVTGFLSRGTYQNYQMDQVYYVGGPFKLIIEKEAKPS